MAFPCSLGSRNSFFGWIWFGTGYTITEIELLVKCGPFREKIPFGKIRSIRRTRIPWSSAALSLDRLEIMHAYGLTQSPRPMPTSSSAG